MDDFDKYIIQGEPTADGKNIPANVEKFPVNGKKFLVIDLNILNEGKNDE